MNAITAIRPDESIHGTVTERAHRHAISVNCPNCDEMEMAARCDLAAMRDQAAIGMARAGDSAVTILGEVTRVATAAVFAPMPTSQLLRIRAALETLMIGARLIERVQRDG